MPSSVGYDILYPRASLFFDVPLLTLLRPLIYSSHGSQFPPSAFSLLRCRFPLHPTERFFPLQTILLVATKFERHSFLSRLLAVSTFSVKANHRCPSPFHLLMQLFLDLRRVKICPASFPAVFDPLFPPTPEIWRPLILSCSI